VGKPQIYAILYIPVKTGWVVHILNMPCCSQELHPPQSCNSKWVFRLLYWARKWCQSCALWL